MMWFLWMGYRPQSMGTFLFREVHSSEVQVAESLYSLRPHELHGILQARVMEWVASPFSRGSFQPRDWTQVFRLAGENDTEINGHRVVFLSVISYFVF